jgi:hypothetical protein
MQMGVFMKKIRDYPFLIIMVILILGISFINFAKKDTEFSEMENRFLAQKPDLTFENVLDTSFGTQYETYVNEQFPFRNQWIGGKAIAETLLGKQENNDIIKGKNGYLFNKQLNVDKQLKKNVNAIKDFGKNTNTKLYVSIVPNSYDILKDYLPKGTPNIDQEALIEECYKTLNQEDSIINIKLDTILKEHKNEYIYYRTDHHWTTLGAYYGYLQFCKEQGLTPVDINTLTADYIENFYGTYNSKYKGVGMKPDTITYYHMPIEKVVIGNEEKSGLYDLEKTKIRDKYAMFLHGNNPISIIYSKENEQNQGKKLLLLKDSYANSMIPYLTYNYQEIYVVDLRYYNDSIGKLIDDNGIQTTFILYNFDTIMTDNHFYRLSR